MSITGISDMGSSMMQGMRNRQRPDPSEMADELFSKLDASGQGWLEKTDLQTAVDKLTLSTDAGATDDTDVEDLFARMDADGDGKVTKQEFSDLLEQFGGRGDGAGGPERGGPPPGGMPPPPSDDVGFTKDELASQLEEIGASDDERSSLIAGILENFEEADADGDGRVSFEEAMAFKQSNESASDASDSEVAATSTNESDDQDRELMALISRLMRSYGVVAGNGEDAAARFSATA
ncbi:MAG: EF-hand domain-containing protein [Ectothiorhodospiraceae bacterium]|nr:EF-hand domain-containing protein [Ectothiorhodospiraceae bacterium]